MAIDFGAHYHPTEVFPSGTRLDDLNELLDGRINNLDALLKLYDGTDVDRVALSQPYYMGGEDEAAVTRANQQLVETAESEDVFPIASIPLLDSGEQSANLFRQAINNGCCAGALETRTRGIELTDEAVEPVFNVADQADVPIFVHPKLTSSLHPEALDDDYRLNSIFGREAALASSISKVIHDGVFDRYENLSLVFHHFGGNIASMLGRVHLQLESGRWETQDTVKSFADFEEQLRQRVYVDTSGFLGYEAPLKSALEVFGPSQILFATDAPFEPRTPEEVSDLLSTVRSNTTQDEFEMITKTNAVELLQ
ncbi:amidohydrolase family protein [Halorientalis sp.]|uniref:amidohydrolase family protein n=1 Tax=Halorientalis sp. TaxID=1931229 RepID=UPI00262D4249|nr:amidohydrolase family protein [Halorientalis sp.]